MINRVNRERLLGMLSTLDMGRGSWAVGRGSWAPLTD